MRKIFSFSFAALLVLALSAFSAMAQSTTTGAIGITVTDPKGAVVPGATVVARNSETNKEETATTDDEGRARITNLQPGTYTVTAEGSGFGKFTQQNIVVEVGVVSSVDAVMAIAGGENIVEITGGAPVINTEAQDFSSTLNQTSINERQSTPPLVYFALLTPVAVPDGNFGLISFRGISGLLNTAPSTAATQTRPSLLKSAAARAYLLSQSAAIRISGDTSSTHRVRTLGRRGRQCCHKSGTTNFTAACSTISAITSGAPAIPWRPTVVLVNGVFTSVRIKPQDVRHQFGGTSWSDC